MTLDWLETTKIDAGLAGKTLCKGSTGIPKLQKAAENLQSKSGSAWMTSCDHTAPTKMQEFW